MGLVAPHWVFCGDGRKIEMRAVPGLHCYFVTEEGEVFSRLHSSQPSGKRLSPRTDKDGYQYVEVTTVDGRKNMRIHRMVALAFLGEQPADLPEVRHKDGNPANNHWQNLAYSTHARNMQDRAEHGRNPKGTRNGRAKVNETDVAEIRHLAAIGVSDAAISRVYKLGPSTVGNIRKGKLWPDVLPANDVREERLVSVRAETSRDGKGISRTKRLRMAAALVAVDRRPL